MSKHTNPLNTCATCPFSRFVDPERVACFGSPPVATPLKAGKNLAGQDVIQFEAMRPIVKATEPSCGSRLIYELLGRLTLAIPGFAEAQPDGEDVPGKPGFGGIDLAKLRGGKPS